MRLELDALPNPLQEVRRVLLLHLPTFVVLVVLLLV